MTKSKVFALGVAMLGFVFGSVRESAASAIDFLGETVQYTWLYPDLNGGTLEGPFTAVVGAGPEFTLFNQSFIPVDVSATNITITWDLTSSPQFTPATFNGPRFFDILGTIPSITGVTINAATTLPGFNSSLIFFDADTIRMNFQGIQLQAGRTVLSVDVQFGQVNADPTVPEPASMFLVGGGVLAAVAKARRRRK